MADRDWDAFARTLETALDMRTRGGFLELFAQVTHRPLASVRKIANTYFHCHLSINEVHALLKAGRRISTDGDVVGVHP